jgi:hypothetical protein
VKIGISKISMSGIMEPEDTAAESSEKRPVRRSRILSEDARLAQELQDQEWRYMRESAAKKKKLEPAPAAPAQPKASSSKGQAARKQQPASSAKQRDAPALPAGKAVDTSGQDKTKAGDLPRRGKLCAKRNPCPPDEDAPGTISFTLVPADMQDALPATRPVHVMGENATVMQIKQLVTERLLPGDSAQDVLLRTPAGLMLGNEHSLKYVRYFLWPPTKGQLNLVYSKEKSFFV